MPAKPQLKKPAAAAGLAGVKPAPQQMPDVYVGGNASGSSGFGRPPATRQELDQLRRNYREYRQPNARTI